MTGLQVQSTTEVLRVVDIGRSFGETTALANCSWSLRSGEVHAIIGENGSGKSTLIKILAGVVRPDRGSIVIAGTELHGLSAPRVSRALGIGVVFQEILVVPTRSVIDNLFLGADGLVRSNGSSKNRRAQSQRLLARLLGQTIDLDIPVSSLGLGQRQVVAIVRALLQEPRALLLDESTSALDVNVRDRLFSVVRELISTGTAVAFVSHRMDEVEQIADRITVLRSGANVATLERSQATPATLFRLMSGEESSGDQRHSDSHRGKRDDAVAVSVSNVVLREGARPVSAELHRGEIVGVAGLEGHGQEAFLQVLAGLRKPEAGTVSRIIDGILKPVTGAQDAELLGVAYVPRERKTEGIFAPLSVVDNFAMPSLHVDSRQGLLSLARMLTRFGQFAKIFGIKASRPAASRITSLSGGNQQKVVMARWLATAPQVLVLNDPTRGVDHATKQDIYDRLSEIAAKGISVVMLSTEVDELLALMDRVLVFREGSLFAEFERRQLERQRLVASYFGHKDVQ